MTLAQIITDYWQFIGSIIAVAVGWWRVSIQFSNWQVLNDRKIKDLETGYTETKAKIDSIYPLLITLQTDMASVKTSLEFIKGSIAHAVKPQ